MSVQERHLRCICVRQVDCRLKDSKRELFGFAKCHYVTTGPEQTILQSGQKLLNNVEFRSEISEFFLREWQKGHYYCLFSGKVLYVFHGGECYEFVPNNEQQKVTVSKPNFLQGEHEEAELSCC